jgi:hypothetical protein
MGRTAAILDNIHELAKSTYSNQAEMRRKRMLSCNAEMLHCRTFHSAQSADFYQSELGKS